MRLALRRAGLHVLPAVRIEGIGEVDLLVEGRLLVELDGFAYHSGRREFRSDRRRDLNALLLGLPTIRFAWEDCSPERVVPAVLAVLEELEPLRHTEPVRSRRSRLLASLLTAGTAPGTADVAGPPRSRRRPGSAAS